MPLLRLSPKVQTLTILPFVVEPRFAEIADGWIYDPQIWDLHWPAPKKDASVGAALAEAIRRSAKGRTICCAVGRRDPAKGFDQFAAVYSAAAPLRDVMLLAYARKVAAPCENVAAQFAAAVGYGVNRFINEAELLDFYDCADRV